MSCYSLAGWAATGRSYIYLWQTQVIRGNSAHLAGLVSSPLRIYNYFLRGWLLTTWNVGVSAADPIQSWWWPPDIRPECCSMWYIKLEKLILNYSRSSWINNQKSNGVLVLHQSQESTDVKTIVSVVAYSESPGERKQWNQARRWMQAQNVQIRPN